MNSSLRPDVHAMCCMAYRVPEREFLAVLSINIIISIMFFFVNTLHCDVCKVFFLWRLSVFFYFFVEKKLASAKIANIEKISRFLQERTGKAFSAGLS